MPRARFHGALVGAGAIAEFHLQSWGRIPEVEMVAVADLQPERARSLADRYGIRRTYADLVSLLDQVRGLDFIDVTAPPEAHLPLVELAASNGLHILLQKPFAPDLEHARRMIDSARAAGVYLAINENWRWRPWFRRMKSMLAEGAVGRPAYARFFVHSSGVLTRTLPPDHRFRTWPRVVLYDWGIHHVDVLRFLFGEPQTVFMRAGRLNEQLQQGESHAVAVFGFDGLTALVDISLASFAPHGQVNRLGPMVEDFRVEGDRGTLQTIPAAPAGTDLLRLTTAAGVNEWPAYEGLPLDAYLASFSAAQGHFIDCLSGKAQPETGAEDNYHTLAAVLAAYRSAESGQVVQLRDPGPPHAEACDRGRARL
jgi:predicted dehydrogenase